VPADQRFLAFGVVRIGSDHLSQLALDLIVPAELDEKREAHLQELPRARLGLEGAVDFIERAREALVGDVVLDQDSGKQRIQRKFRPQLDKLGGRGVALGGIIRKDGLPIELDLLEQPDFGIVRGERDDARRVEVERLPLAGLGSDAGDRDAAFDIVRVLLGHEGVAAEGVAQVAALKHRRCVQLAGLDMRPVQLEDVAQFDQRAVDVTGGKEFHGAFVVALRALLGRIAGREQKQCGKRHRRESDRSFRHDTYLTLAHPASK
jgi:hypothetical protein